MAQLARQFSLLDIEDVEAFSRWVMRGRIPPADEEDALAFLIAEAWRVSLGYDDGIGSFATFARTALQRRLIDWRRQRYGRTRWKFADHVYERPRVELALLDDVAERELERALAARDSDRAADRDKVVGGLLAERDRRRAADLELLGLGPGA